MCIDSERGKLLIEKGEMGVEGAKATVSAGLFFFFFFSFQAKTMMGFVWGRGVWS